MTIIHHCSRHSRKIPKVNNMAKENGIKRVLYCNYVLDWLETTYFIDHGNLIQDVQKKYTISKRCDDWNRVAAATERADKSYARVKHRLEAQLRATGATPANVSVVSKKLLSR